MMAAPSDPMFFDRAPITDVHGVFDDRYNRTDFVFPHQLAGNPLFELSSLLELARRMPDHGEHYWSNGNVVVSDTWANGTAGRSSLADTIANIERNNSIVILKHTEQDEIYAPVLQSTLRAIVDLAGDRLRSDATIGEVLILISSPGRITPYHMDSETNFLLQVTGDKWFHVFDHADRTLVTHAEREQFFAVTRNFAVYRPELAHSCRKYDLRAGQGVHVPPCSPHWVQNKNNVSVALSVNYELRSVDRMERLYRLNHRLRRVGINPSAPGDSAWRDRLKLAAAGAVSSLRALVRPRKPRSFSIWTPTVD